jgi:predicted ATPase
VIPLQAPATGVPPLTFLTDPNDPNVCGAKLFELRAATSLCRFRTRSSRCVTARQHLEEVYGRFSEGFDTCDLRQARALLDEEHRTSRRG